MKKLFCICFVLLSYAICIADSIEKLSIAHCYALARENYPASKRFDLIKQSESYNLENATSGYYPQISLNANAAFLSDTPEMLAAGGLSHDQYHAGITINQVIWDGGNISAHKRVTSAQARAELENNEVLLYQLNDRINKLYFGILLQNELLLQNEIQQKDIQTVIDKIQSMISGGIANDYDLNQARVELLNAQQNKTSILSAKKSYMNMISLLLGVEINEHTEFEIPESIEVLKDTIRRPELDFFIAKEALFESKKETVEASLMPKISLFAMGSYGRASLSGLDKFDFFGIGGISFTWSFSNFYTQVNERMSLDVEKRLTNLERETFLLNTRIQMVQQDIEIKKMAELLNQDKNIVNLRTEIAEAAFARMSNGVLSVQDFMRELNAKDLAKQQLIFHKIQKLSYEYNFKYISNN